MKTIKIKKSSWHYRFINKMNFKPLNAKNDCDYVRRFVMASFTLIMTITAMIAMTAVTLIISWGVGSDVLGENLFSDNLILNVIAKTIVGAVTIIVFATSLFFTISIFTGTKTKLEKRLNSEYPSPIIMKYKSLKEKICHPVEIVE